MKKLLPLIPLLLIATTPLAADYLYQGGDANWTASNWNNSTGSVSNSAPGTGTDNHSFGSYVNSSVAGTVTVNSSVVTNDLNADRGTRTLDIASGGTMLVNGTANIVNRANEASALTVNMNGTSFTITKDLSVSSLNAGDTTTFNLNAGTLNLTRGGALNSLGTAGITTFNVQGAAFTGAATTGFSVNTNSVLNVRSGSVNLSSSLILGGGAANIIGDTAGTLQLGAAAYQGLSVTNSASQLNYVFDSTGVSALNMGRLAFNSGITLNLNVNADALAGATVGQEILLMDYSEWRLNNVDQGTAPIVTSLQFSNLGTLVTGSLVNNTTAETLSFKVDTVVPEPSTYAFFAGLIILGITVLRRRR